MRRFILHPSYFFTKWPLFGILLLLAGLGCNSATTLVDRLAASTSTPAAIAQVLLPTLTPSPAPAPAVANQAPANAAAEIDAAGLDIEERRVIDLYERVAPSVVSITTQVLRRDFFFDVVPEEGAGSGFVLDSEGHILTNYHVIDGAAAHRGRLWR